MRVCFNKYLCLVDAPAGTSSAATTRINCSRSSMSVHIPAAGATAAAGVTSWQLSFQQHLPVCNGLQQLPATVSCCCLLALHPSAAAATSADTSQQWQQLLAAAGCRSNTSYINTLQTLAAAATATISGCSSRSNSRTEPHCCCCCSTALSACCWAPCRPCSPCCCHAPSAALSSCPVWPLSDSSLPPFPFICCTMQPTNHLDLEACVWLEDYLANFKRILLMVSHRHACARTGTGGFAACAALC